MENGKLDEDPLEEEDEGQRRRKRSKKTTNKESPPESGLYQSHPFNVILHVYDDGDNYGADDTDDNVDMKTCALSKLGKLVTLRFEYLLQLKVVCVGTERSENESENDLLSNLFPDDTGVDLPHQVQIVVPICSYFHTDCYDSCIHCCFDVYNGLYQ